MPNQIFNLIRFDTDPHISDALTFPRLVQKFKDRNITVVSAIGCAGDGKTTLLNNIGRVIEKMLCVNNQFKPFDCTKSTIGMDISILEDKFIFVDTQGLQNTNAKYDHYILLISYIISNVIVLTVRERLDLQIFDLLFPLIRLISEIPEKFKRNDKPILLIRIKDFQNIPALNEDFEYLTKSLNKLLKKSNDRYDLIREVLPQIFTIKIDATFAPKDNLWENVSVKMISTIFDTTKICKLNHNNLLCSHSLDDSNDLMEPNHCNDPSNNSNDLIEPNHCSDPSNNSNDLMEPNHCSDPSNDAFDDRIFLHANECENIVLNKTADILKSGELIEFVNTIKNIKSFDITNLDVYNISMLQFIDRHLEDLYNLFVDSFTSSKFYTKRYGSKDRYDLLVMIENKMNEYTTNLNDNVFKYVPSSIKDDKIKMFTNKYLNIIVANKKKNYNAASTYIKEMYKFTYGSKFFKTMFNLINLKKIEYRAVHSSLLNCLNPKWFKIQLITSHFSHIDKNVSFDFIQYVRTWKHIFINMYEQICDQIGYDFDPSALHDQLTIINMDINNLEKTQNRITLLNDREEKYIEKVKNRVLNLINAKHIIARLEESHKTMSFDGIHCLLKRELTGELYNSMASLDTNMWYLSFETQWIVKKTYHKNNSNEPIKFVDDNVNELNKFFNVIREKRLTQIGFLDYETMSTNNNVCKFVIIAVPNQFSDIQSANSRVETKEFIKFSFSMTEQFSHKTKFLNKLQKNITMCHVIPTTISENYDASVNTLWIAPNCDGPKFYDMFYNSMLNELGKIIADICAEHNVQFRE